MVICWKLSYQASSGHKLMELRLITIRKEPYSECISEMMEMYPAHYDELSRTKQKPLNPLYQTYSKLAEAGLIHVIAVRDDGKLIGYLMFLLSPDMHYGDLAATEDIYYLKPEYRGRMIGSRMFSEFESEARKLGAWRILVSTKVHKDNSSLFGRLGLVEHEKTFIKVL